MAGLRDVLGGVYRRDDPTEGENEATMLEEPPVQEASDLVDEASVWGPDTDDVPETPEIVDVDASTLIPGADTPGEGIDWEAVTSAEPFAEDDAASSSDDDVVTPRVFDLDDPDHGAPAWDIPDDEVPSAVTSSTPDLDLLADDTTDTATAGSIDVDWDAATTDSIDVDWDAATAGSIDVDWDAATTESIDTDGGGSGTDAVTTRYGGFDWDAETTGTGDELLDADLSTAAAINLSDLDASSDVEADTGKGPWIRSDDDIVPAGSNKRSLFRRN